MKKFDKFIMNMFIIVTYNGNILGAYTKKEDAVGVLGEFTEEHGRYYPSDDFANAVAEERYCYIKEQELVETVSSSSNWDALKPKDTIQLVTNGDVLEAEYEFQGLRDECCALFNTDDNKFVVVAKKDYNYLKC